MKRLILSLLALLAATVVVTAQKVVTITGEATYYGDATDSPADARRKALERARLNALAEKFGTVISGSDISRGENLNGRETSFFSSLTSTEVKGEWIADEGEPEYKFELDSDGHYVVSCKVSVKARALSNKAPDFKALPLRNGTEERHFATEFASGDDLFLQFLAPVNGYVAVYLVAGNEVMTLLPYQASTTGKVPVKAGKTYVFFSSAHADPNFGTADELTLGTDDTIERDQLYVLFSPREFAKALDHGGTETQPRSLSYTDFAKWISRLRSADDEMGMKVFNIVITGNQQ